MKSKGKFIFILMAILLCSIMAAFISACDNNGSDNAHSHSYSIDWSYDDDYHWHKAVCEHTSETSEKARHNFIDGKCTICAYKTKEQSSVAEKKTYDMSKVVFADLTITYDGKAHAITATNLPDGVTATYEGNGIINAGTYTITAHFIGDSINYYPIPDKSVVLTICKANYDMSNVLFNNLTVEYNGQGYSILATNLPEGVTVTYENNGKIDAGAYTIIAHFTGDSSNYNHISDKTAILTITRAIHNVTFKQEDQADIVKKVLDLSGIPESDIPTPIQKTGYTVIWEEIDLSRVTEDTIVNAVYIPNQYKITYFDRASDSIFSGQFEKIYPKFHTYDSITYLIEPVREGYLFTGWFNNSMCEGSEVTALAIQDYTEDITLYARWAATITFNTDGGTEISAITQNPDTPISEPEEVTIKKSYVFVKWQLNGEDYVFEVMPNYNITLVAVWEFFEDGTEFYPYIIENKDQLMKIEELDGKDGSSCFELANDINLDGSTWIPIITFNGTINGNNYKICNFTISTMLYVGLINYSFEYETGLFCSTGLNSVIENLGIEDFSISLTMNLSEITGYSKNLYAGGIAGRNNGVIKNCYSTGKIDINAGVIETSTGIKDTSGSLYIGGLAGQNSGSISNSYNLGAVHGIGHYVCVGGIAGDNSGMVNFCWTEGNIRSSGTYYAHSGGLVAKNSGTISNCFATGKVDAFANINSSNVDVYGGGLVGYNYEGNIYFSYATGDVTVYHQGSNRYSYGGGLVGKHSNGLVLGCFATGSIKGYGSNLGGVAGSSIGGTIAMSSGYVGQVISGKSYSEGCTFLQLNDKEFYLNELGWNANDWDLSNLDFLNGYYPKICK